MSEHYYVDGYNLLHAVPDWSALADGDLEAARDALIEAVSRWSAHTGHHVCVFFDGQGRFHNRVTGHPARPQVDVVFTSSRLSADALIERGVYDAPKRDTVIVVTSDRGISDFCLGLGALTMRAANFAELLRASPVAPRTRREDASATLEHRIDADAITQLRQLRDQLDKQERG